MASTRLARHGSHSVASAAAAEAGGRAELDALYQLHFGGIYDFAARVVGDPDAATPVVRGTLAAAWNPIRLGRAVNHPKAWLYSLARVRASDELRRRRYEGQEPGERRGAQAFRVAPAQPGAAPAELVWRAAGTLSADDYALLDMHVRRGLGAAQLTEVLNLERSTIYTRLSRLRGSLEEAVAAPLLAARAPEDCDVLSVVLERHVERDALDPELRRAIRAHVRECERCADTRRQLGAGALDAFASLLPVPAPAGVREAVWNDVMAATPVVHRNRQPPRPGPGAVTLQRLPHVPKPPRALPRLADRRVIAGAGVTAAVIALLVVLGSGSGASKPALGAPARAARPATAPTSTPRPSGARRHRRRHHTAATAPTTAPATPVPVPTAPQRSHHHRHNRRAPAHRTPPAPRHHATRPPRTTKPHHTHSTPPAAPPPATTQTAPTTPTAPAQPAPAPTGGTTTPATP